MATTMTIVVTDDMDHSKDNVATYRLSLEGVEYEIDLAPHNLARLGEALAPYIAAGRRLRKPTAARRGPGARDSRRAAAEVRGFWAAHQQQMGLPPHRSHGPIPHTVRDAYRAAH